MVFNREKYIQLGTTSIAKKKAHKFASKKNNLAHQIA
jgi:hypothetical protein